MIKMAVFDLDGTLTESKTTIDLEMVKLLEDLLKTKLVAVISGASFEQFEKQLIARIKNKKVFGNLLFFPTNGASFYRYQNDKWSADYQHLLSAEKKKKIFEAFKKTYKDIDYKDPEKIYGTVIEDRGSEVTFSALGQQAPLLEKYKWNRTQDVRIKIKKVLDKYLPEFKVMIAGTTSIDVVQKGIDKGFAIDQMRKIFKLNKNEIVFVGDAIRPEGNDYTAVKSGVEMIKITGPEETKKIIRSWL